MITIYDLECNDLLSLWQLLNHNHTQCVRYMLTDEWWLWADRQQKALEYRTYSTRTVCIAIGRRLCFLLFSSSTRPFLSTRDWTSRVHTDQGGGGAKEWFVLHIHIQRIHYCLFRAQFLCNLDKYWNIREFPSKMTTKACVHCTHISITAANAAPTHMHTHKSKHNFSLMIQPSPPKWNWFFGFNVDERSFHTANNVRLELESARLSVL